MRKKLTIVTALLIITFVCAGCGTPSADFDSPKAVIDAYLETHSLEGESFTDINADLAGKTVCVKTNEKDDPIFTVYSNVTISTGIYVILENGAPSYFDYNNGDTLVLEITSIMVRAYKNGSYRDFFINTKLTD